jgi:hypothetical protein
MKNTQTKQQTCQIPSVSDRPGFPLDLPAKGIKENMGGIDADTRDQVSLRLSGIIGVFDLLVDTASKVSTADASKENGTMINFAYYISSELQSLYKTIFGVDYK